LAVRLPLGFDVRNEGFEVIKLGVHMTVKVHTMAVSIAEVSLENTEQTTSAGNGNNHAAQLTEDLMPLGDRNAWCMALHYARNEEKKRRWD